MGDRSMVRNRFALATVGVLFLITFAAPPSAQELGPIQTFGSNGRLYSLDNNEHYLLSRRSYGTEDSVGYQGQIRLVIKYVGGGYEIQTREYIARCRAVDGHSQVTTYEQGREDETRSSAAIVNFTRVPSPDMKNAYNLFWAACFDQFRKFK
jgi:hypothetical protein